MVVAPLGKRVSCKGLEVRFLSAAPHAVVAHYGKSAVKRIPVAGTGSRSTERQAKPKPGKVRLLKCVGKRVILDAMLRQREWVRAPSTAPPSANDRQIEKLLKLLRERGTYPGVAQLVSEHGLGP